MQNKWPLLPQMQVLLEPVLPGCRSPLLLLPKSRLKGEASAVLHAGFTTAVSRLFPHGLLGTGCQKSFQPTAG